MERERGALRRWVCLLLTLALLWGLAPGLAPAAQAAGARKVNLFMSDVNHCDIYYSEGGPLTAIREGERLEKTTEGPYGILFFAAPHDGYALSAMTASNTEGNYFSISDIQPDGTDCEFLSQYRNYKNLVEKGGYTEEQVRRIVTEAVDMGCDGVMLFSRGAQESKEISSDLVFYAEQLPTLEKRIRSVTDVRTGQVQAYTQGMSVGLGDVIEYALDVTFYALENPKFSIEYSDVYVTDEKTGHTGENRLTIPAPTPQELQALTSDLVVTQPVRYTITQQDVEQGTVVNQAQLTYRYQSLHSMGQLDTTSDARAEIRVHASVSYAYRSGTENLELPDALAALAPVDYSYHAEHEPVVAQPHAQTRFWDEERGGYWILDNDGLWSGIADGVAPGDDFSMPAAPVTLSAVWVFAGAPAIEVEKSGSVAADCDPAQLQPGDTVPYTASYTLTIRNTGTEPLRSFAVGDETLPVDWERDLALEIDETPVSWQDAVWDPLTQTLTAVLPGEGLSPGQTLTLTYARARTGVLGEKLVLTDESSVDVTALGGRTGLEAHAGDGLSIQTALEHNIILIPADIVIYAGGTATGSEAVGGDGTVNTATNLPEPGFFVVLPLEAEQALREATGSTGEVDLSRYLTFTDSQNNVWGLRLFSDAYSMANGRYLYRLEPREPAEQEPIQMQFFDEASGRYIVQSEFDITNALQQEYKMTIYPGEIPAENPRAVLTSGEEKIGTYGLGVSPGKLIIRGTTDALATSGILTEEPEKIGQICACAGDSVEYYINESMLTVQREDVALLVDDIVNRDYNQTLLGLAEPVLSEWEGAGRLHCQFQYLDLVDTSMGNAWVTASEPLEILWPYPEGVDERSGFTIIHYRGLDRDYDLEDMANLELGTDYTLEVYSTEPFAAESPWITCHPLHPGESGLTFQVDRFSPFLLLWEEEEPASGGSEAAEEGAETPAPAGEDHSAYLVGRGGGGIQPLAPITRSEVAAIFYRLLPDEAKARGLAAGHTYSDVPADAWYADAVWTLTGLDLLHGDGEGAFRPQDTVTRAEFVWLATQYSTAPETTGEIRFPDVAADAWYADAVAAASALGLVQGRGDGTFGPEEQITRAEAAVIVNHLLGRRPRGGQLMEDAVSWWDNPRGTWYYEDMLEASVSHRCIWSGPEELRWERWTALLR